MIAMITGVSLARIDVMRSEPIPGTRKICSVMTAPVKIAGIWSATSVNGHSVAGPAFTKSVGGRECFQETLGATLLLDSSGNWSALMTYRDRCKGDPAPRKGTEQSMLLNGTFEVSGQALALSGQAEPMRGTISADEITVLLNGVGEYSSETATFVLKRRR